MVWCAVSCGSLGAAVVGAYQVGAGTATLRPELAGLQLVVLSAEVGAREIQFRVGYRNAGVAAFEGKIAVPAGTVRLESARLGKLLEAAGVEASLVEPDFAGGLRPGTTRMGSVRFELAPADDGEWLAGPMSLTVPPFLPVSFTLNEAGRFEPVLLPAPENPLAGALVLPPVAATLAALPLRVEAVRVVEGRLVLEVAAVNESRFPLRWSGKFGLEEMRVLTGESELLSPLQVTGALAEGPGQAGAVWPPGGEKRGGVSFPMPHAHAAATLTLLMPGYAPVALLHDYGEGVWQVVKRAETDESLQGAQGVRAVRAEEELFASVAAFWQEQGRRLQGRDQMGYLAGFTNEHGARDAQAASLAGLVRVPVSKIGFLVPPLQRLGGSDVEVTGLQVELSCLLSGLPEANEFVTQWRCDLRRETVSAPWRVTRIKLEGREPFWSRGFTELLATEHFLVFYQLDADQGARRARSAGEQLEKAWDRLRKTPVAPGPRYAAFVVPDKEDFRALTGRDPGAITGATSAAFAMREGELRVMNQAMYVNDSHFSSLQRSWGKPDRLVTMQHELVHLALANYTRPWTPAWLVEGMAAYYAGQLDSFSREALRQRMPGGRVLAHLSTRPFLGAGGEEAQELKMQYSYSAAAVRWIERQFGEKTLMELYTAFARVKPKQWENSPPGQTDGQRSEESEAMRQIRLEIAEGIVARILSGWHLDQVDAAVRMELLR